MSAASRKPWALPVEVLERRTLLAFGPVGPPIGMPAPAIGAAVAMDAHGNSLLAWLDAPYNAPWTVHARRYNSAGQPLGDEFRIDTPGIGSIAMDADGDFVVAWYGAVGQEAATISARRFNPVGQPVGDEIRVSATASIVSGWSSRLVAAMDDDGDFVIAWNGYDADGGGLYARRFNAAGHALGDEFLVNTTTAGTQWCPSVAIDSDGDFVVAWESRRETGVQADAYVRRYSASGQPSADEFHVGPGYAPSVAMNAGGEFIVGVSDASRLPYVRRFGAAGQPLGAEIRVGTDLPDFGAVAYPTIRSVAMDDAGGFVVLWMQEWQGWSGPPPVFAQRFSSAGEPIGRGFFVGFGSRSIAMDANGDFVVAWNGHDPFDGLPAGFSAQRYGSTPGPRVSQIFLNGTQWTAAFREHLASKWGVFEWGDASLGMQVWVNPLPWTNIDQVSVRFDEPVVVLDRHLSVEGVNISDYGVTRMDYDAQTYTATWTLALPLRNDRVIVTLDAGPGGVLDLDGHRLDGELFNAPSGDGIPGGDFRFRLNVLPGDVDGSGAVLANDYSDVKRRFFTSTTNPGSGHAAYSIFRDVNGDGRILADDFSEVKRRFFTTLPPERPAAVPTAAGVPLARPATREWFGLRPILA